MDFSAPPSPAAAAQFDARSRTWTLSRYADVQAALREPTFRQASAQGRITFVAGAADHMQLRAGAQVDIDRMSTPQWRAQMENIARLLMGHAAIGQTVNLLRQVIEPWSTTVMLNLSMADQTLPDPDLEERLIQLADVLFHKREKDPAWWARRMLGRSLATRWSKWRRKEAEAHLDRLIKCGWIKISKSMFFAETQTVPSLLASAWLALLQNPEQRSKLGNDPSLMPGAVEELIRYAGVVHTLYRRATEDVALGDVDIARDDFMILKIESANRDPLKFDSPDELDLTRRPVGNLGFGTGAHACIGAALVRTALALTTPALLAADPELASDAAIAWMGDSSVRWPLVVPARLRRQTG